LEKCLNADAVIVGSPVYHSYPTGMFRSFLERFMFPAHTYLIDRENGGLKRILDHTLPVGVIMTMNATEEQFKQHHYDVVLGDNEWSLRAVFGYSETLYAFDTFQYTDYTKYDCDLFDPVHKAKVRDEQFPKDLQAAYEMGKNVVIGLKNGIEDPEAVAAAISAARSVAEQVNAALQEGLGESSPSAIAHGFGRFYDIGLANGISDYAGLAIQSTEEMSEGIINTANEIVSTIQSVLDDNMDAQPRIRPVLDTSDITDKARRIGRLFSGSDLSLLYETSGGFNTIQNDKVSSKLSESEKVEAKPEMQLSGSTQGMWSREGVGKAQRHVETQQSPGSDS
jgi:multimeric flavodoxin WrbA